MTELVFALNVLLAGIGAGFMLSYAITLGGLFNWILRSDHDRFFTDVYAPFRKQSRAKIRYGSVIPGAQMLVAGLSLVANVGYRQLWPQLTALALFPLYYALIHRPTGFAAAEEAINSGTGAAPSAIRTYLRWNLPLHYLLAALYAATCISLILA